MTGSAQQSSGLGSASSGSSGGGGGASNSIAIDLSTIGGLAPYFFGDQDQTTALEQRRILVNDTNNNQVADGYFNPWLRQGYMSPAVGTLQALSYSGGNPANVLTSSQYDGDTGIGYFAELGTNIYTLNGLDSFTLNLTHTVDPGLAIDDLEIYEIDGSRTLFYTYSNSSTLVTFNTTGHIVTAAEGHYANGTVVQFTGTSLPAGINSTTQYFIISSTGGVTFQVSTTFGGSPVIFTSNGSGSIVMTGVNGLGGCGIYDFNGTWTDNWITGTATNTVINPINLTNNSHFLRLGNDGYMYIMDGNAVHRIDGSILGGISGTVTPNVYSVLPYWIITDAVSYRQQMFIAAKDNNTLARTINGSFTADKTYNVNAFVAIWDMTATATETKDIITIPGIQSVQKLFITPTGKLRAICVSSNGLTKLMEYDGTQFTLIMHLGLGAAPQFPDALLTTDTLTIWTGNDGNIYGHGPVADDTTEVLAKIGNFFPVGSTTPKNNIPYAGALMYGGQGSFSASSGYRTGKQGLTIAYYDSSTSPKVTRIYPFDKGTINGVNQNPMQSDIFTGVHFLESSTASFYTGTRFISQLSTIGFINIFFPAAGSGGATVQATVRIYLNGSTTQWGAGKTITRDDIKKGYKRIEMNQPYVNTIQLKFEYPTSSVLSDTTDFHPYQALVYYSPTNTRGGKN